MIDPSGSACSVKGFLLIEIPVDDSESESGCVGGVLSRTKVDGIMQRKEGRVLCEGLQLLSWNLERQKKRDMGLLKGGWEVFPLEHEAE